MKYVRSKHEDFGQYDPLIMSLRGMKILANMDHMKWYPK